MIGARSSTQRPPDGSRVAHPRAGVGLGPEPRPETGPKTGPKTGPGPTSRDPRGPLPLRLAATCAGSSADPQDLSPPEVRR